MSHPAAFLSAFALLLSIALTASAYAEAIDTGTTLSASRQQSLVGVLESYEATGVSFVYSRRLVRPSSTVDTSATELDGSLDTLRRLLAAVRMELLDTENPSRYLIVRAEGRESFYFSGSVRAAESGQPIADASIRAGLRVATSSQSGLFRLGPVFGRRLQVDAPGYRRAEVIGSEDGPINVVLYAKPVQIEEVVVTSSRYALKRDADRPVSSHQLRDNELGSLPELGDDALRAALHLPGVATVGVSAQPHIRGGLRDETLILFDGVELLEPFHLKDFQSLFSGLNPSLIESIDVYTGGFPARYGQRLSGVMAIEPVSDYQYAGGEVLLSALTSGVSLHGPWASGKGDWVASVRRGNLDLVIDLLGSDVGRPKYQDYFLRASRRLGSGGEVSATVVAYDDDIFLTDSEFPGEDGERASSRYRNAYGWLKWQQHWLGFESTTVASLGHIRHNRIGEIIDDEPDDSNAFARDKRRFDLATLQHRTSAIDEVGNGWEIGAEIKRQRARFDYQADVLRGALAELIGSGESVSRRLSLRPSGVSGGVYLSRLQKLPGPLTAELGLRWDFQDFANRDDAQLSPRVSLLAELSSDTRVRFSVGRFYQPEAVHELQINDGFSTYQRPQRADHYIGSIDHHREGSAFRWRAEAFYKAISDPKRRFENLFDSLVLLPELASDRVPIEAERARAKGVELSMGYERRQLSTWLSYTYSRAEDLLDGSWSRRSWDQEHSLSAGLFWQSRRWTFALTGLWHSGWPATSLPAVIRLDEPFDIQRNTDSLGSYLSVDMRIARHWQRGRHELTAFAELTNALSHRNVGSREVDLEEIGEDTGVFAVQQIPVRVLPWVPSVGLTWRF